MSAKFLDLVRHEQKGQIKKASSQRLFKWLVDSSMGMSEDDAEKLSREQLMEAWAEAVYTGRDTKKVVEVKAGTAGGMAKHGYDPEVERERLEFEREKWKVEREDQLREKEERLRREEMEFELRRAEIALKGKKNHTK